MSEMEGYYVNIKIYGQQMALLRSNPFIVEITPNKISFSRDFKEQIWMEIESGKDIHIILEEHGLPCSILGEVRISGIKYLIRKAARAGGSFTDAGSLTAATNGFMTPEKRIKQLERMLEYKEQGIEFLKKCCS